MSYVVKKYNGQEDVYVSIEPVLDKLAPNQYPVCFAWVTAQAEAVRFSTKWHAEAVAKALPGKGVVVEAES